MLRSYLAMLLVFAFTLLISALLLFMVEPMIGKMILPLLGGTPAVWNTCMVFFQAVLLAGYAYAHFSTTWLGPRKQAVLHMGLLALPFVFLPLAVNRDLIQGGENPILGLLLLLSVTVGVPMFVVSASAPLLQKWFASTSHPAAKDPYFLYGASNLGSMIALIAYPLVVEPYLRLGQQSVDWTAGYAMLAAVTACCAVFLWRSPPKVETEGITTEAGAGQTHLSEARSSTAIQPNRRGIRRRGKHSSSASPAKTAICEEPAKSTQPTASGQALPLAEASSRSTLSGDVTWLRIVRWVALAFVPSSLMLGATTYITTDIAAIPLLWVAPLTLYLLTFIIVFSHVPAWLQWVMLVVAGTLLTIGLAAFLWTLELSGSRLILQAVLRYTVVPLLFVCCFAGGWWAWLKRNAEMLHRAMVLVMPLLVLALLFFMLSELKTEHHWITCSLCMHLITLFVVAMVCHGELARDRPAAKYLTGYYLWMSVGGVLGGLFNALLAPVIFTGIVEYELVMMLACFLAPPLEPVKDTTWSRRFDMILAGLFVGIGALLALMRVSDRNLHYDLLRGGPWVWQLAALIVGIGIGIAVVLRARGKKFDRWMDLALPLCLAVLLVGLSWGLWSAPLSPRVDNIAAMLHLDDERLRRILTYGVPIVLCYTFVERSLRFALGVGAVLLAGGFCGIFENDVFHQERSFFGVLKVEHQPYKFNEAEYDPATQTYAYTKSVYFNYRRLVHGTTLHGMQLVEITEIDKDGERPIPLGERRDEPLTYYHRSGPIGEVMMVYNGEDTPVEKMNLGVIGLGTGTMACYARPGQRLTFYDIDPIVKRFSFDEDDPYFTYVQHARERGARLDLVMGDARLTMERQQLQDAEKYGVMVIDAFSSDAIPIHLITREAMQIYLDKLADDGLLCFHISNRHLDLRPVLYNLAQEHYRSAENGLTAISQSDDSEKDRRSTALFGKSSSTWVVLTRHEERLIPLLDLNDWEKKRQEARRTLQAVSLLPDNGMGLASQAILMSNLLDEALCKRPAPWKILQQSADEKPWPDLKSVGVWTDDYSNLLSVFWW